MIKIKPTSRELLRDSMVPASFMGMLDTFFNEASPRAERHAFFTPKADVAETPASFELHLVLPGMKKEEVSISVENDRLIISGERKLSTDNKDVKYHMMESFYGKFSRSFHLPEHVNKAAISAALNDGILTLSLPKAEVKDSKTSIAIN